MAAVEDRDPPRVRAMFGSIAPRYDLLNRVLSLGRDASWRRAAAALAGAAPSGIALDICGGTGDLAALLVRSGRFPLVVCADFTHAMLVRAARKIGRMALPGSFALLEADALRLPLRDGSVAAVTVAFGVRNFADLSTGLLEALRVLAPGGRLVVLEFSRPTSPVLSAVYGLYLRRILPRFADAVSGKRGPYGYLARTIGEFPDPPALAGTLREAGFAAAGWTPLSGGIVCVHTAIKAG